MDCKEENEKLKAKADDAKNLAEQAARPIFGANWFKRTIQKTGPNLRNHVIVTMVYTRIEMPWNSVGSLKQERQKRLSERQLMEEQNKAKATEHPETLDGHNVDWTPSGSTLFKCFHVFSCRWCPLLCAGSRTKTSCSGQHSCSGTKVFDDV